MLGPCTTKHLHNNRRSATLCSRPWHRQVLPKALPGFGSDDTVLLAKKEKLESLLKLEGIELIGDQQSPSTSTPSIPVDWSRYHLQLLFVDDSDTLRARVAAGIFERIAEWNGFGRAMYTHTAGLHACATPQAAAAVSTTSSSQEGALPRTAGILSAASALKLSLKDMTRPREQFEVDDLDRYDLIVCLDHSIKDAVFAQLAPEHRDYYEQKVCLLTNFSQYEVESIVLARGGLALLPMQLSFLLRTGKSDLLSLREAQDIASPQLSGERASEEWGSMVQAIIWCTAGLVKFLIDAMPEEEPQY